MKDAQKKIDATFVHSPKKAFGPMYKEMEKVRDAIVGTNRTAQGLLEADKTDKTPLLNIMSMMADVGEVMQEVGLWEEWELDQPPVAPERDDTVSLDLEDPILAQMDREAREQAAPERAMLSTIYGSGKQGPTLADRVGVVTESTEAPSLKDVINTINEKGGAIKEDRLEKAKEWALKKESERKAKVKPIATIKEEDVSMNESQIRLQMKEITRLLQQQAGNNGWALKQRARLEEELLVLQDKQRRTEEERQNLAQERLVQGRKAMADKLANSVSVGVVKEAQGMDYTFTPNPAPVRGSLMELVNGSGKVVKKKEKHIKPRVVEVEEVEEVTATVVEEDTFKVVVAGSREFDDYALLKKALNHYLGEKENVQIVSGGARGADTLGEQWAKENGKSIKRFPADWKQYGKSAGHKRNAQMAEYADAAILFWDGYHGTKGTANMKAQAEKAGLPVRVVRY